ncbi:MAG: AAA family ATPase [Roseibium sp.]|nr:AAA family ATPase [Roseibium sp.]
MNAPAPVEDEDAEAYEFDAEFQQKIGALVLRDTAFLKKTNGLIDPRYFENEAVGAVVGSVLDYFETHKKAPSTAVVSQVIKDAIAKKRIRKDLIPDVKAVIADLFKADLSDGSFVADQVAEFAKHQALTHAIMESVNHLDKGDYSKIESLIKAASQVGVDEATNHYDFWEQVEARTDVRKSIAAGTAKLDGITTGCEELDKRLYHHGWGRKELSLLMGAAKAGKSMGLGHFAACANLAGYHVLYVTLENSQEVTADRLDANISNISVGVLKDKPIAVKDELVKAQKKAGRFEILEYASGCLKPSALRRAIDGFRANGKLFDLIVVDYADIMAPEHYTGDLREDMRQIYLALRAIAHEENAAVLTATQTNREGAKSAVAKATDVAEDFNKIRTADIVLSINSTEQERQSGEARIFFAAARNVRDGYTIRVSQDRSTMRFLKKVLNEE